MLKLLPEDLINHVLLFCDDKELYSLKSIGINMDTYKIMVDRNETIFEITNKAIIHNNLELFDKCLSNIYRGDLHRHYVQSIVYDFDPGIYACHKLIYLDHHDKKSLPIYQQGLLINEKYSVMQQIMDDDIWIDDISNYKVIKTTKLNWGKLINDNSICRILGFLHTQRGISDSITGDIPVIEDMDEYFIHVFSGDTFNIIQFCIENNLNKTFKNICLKYYSNKLNYFHVDKILCKNKGKRTDFIVDLLNKDLRPVVDYIKINFDDIKNTSKMTNLLRLVNNLKITLPNINKKSRKKLNRIIEIYHDYLWNNLKVPQVIDLIENINKLNCFKFNPRKYFHIAVDNGYDNILRYLIKMGLKLNKQDLIYISTNGTFNTFLIASYYIEDKHNIVLAGYIMLMFIIFILTAICIKKKYYNSGYKDACYDSNVDNFNNGNFDNNNFDNDNFDNDNFDNGIFDNDNFDNGIFDNLSFGNMFV